MTQFCLSFCFSFLNFGPLLLPNLAPFLFIFAPGMVVLPAVKVFTWAAYNMVISCPKDPKQGSRELIGSHKHYLEKYTLNELWVKILVL